MESKVRTYSTDTVDRPKPLHAPFSVATSSFRAVISDSHLIHSDSNRTSFDVYAYFSNIPIAN